MTADRFRPLPGRSPVFARRGMVATSHHAATDVALDVLKAGGNALDAAIAACAMQCVVEPQSTGIGGDCFVLYSSAGRATPLAFNGSGRAPAGATVEALEALGVTSLERNSAHSVTVPGAIDAWTRLHSDHGRFPFADLLAPAVTAAREGFVIAPRVAFDTRRQASYLTQFERSSRLFLDVDGKAPVIGSVRRLPELADALELIAHEGRAGLHEGELAQGIVDELRDRGGLHTLADLADARGEYVTPIATDYRGLTVHECPPNGQGLIALLLLNMMQEVPVDSGGPLSVQRIHFELEACRLAYHVRDRHLADPTHADVPVERILSREHALELLASIDPEHATESPGQTAPSAHRDTVYISVVDADRNACSFINTLFWPYGSGITTRHGIMLTNRGQSFSLDPASPNVIAPGKRPRHTIIPGMGSIGDKTTLCFGVMGGEYQAMGQQQFLSRYRDFGCDIQTAMDMPRFMVDPDTGDVDMEVGIDDATREALVSMGHRIAEPQSPIGGSQAIAIDPITGVLCGGTDPRKDGAVAGY